ncbi:ABC transporter substrate-binding protein [Moraxella bovoculi]|uniref:ABC transporter substrate-binding protein n=1 Tax=Moraxella bovoculi TaxID=386891 RepID=UPI003F500439
MTLSKFIKGALIATAALILLACAPKEQNAKESAQDVQKLTLLLDWFVNPNHAAIIIAKQQGYFDEQGLDVEITEPADPSMPPKLVASNQADIAVDYQPQLQQSIAQGLPLVRIGTVINTPLNSLVILKDSNITKLEDLKGKKIGYSVSGFEELLLKTMLQSVNLTDKDVQMVNVNWSLSPSLLSGQADGVIGAFRNFELNQLHIEKREGVAFYPEEHGVPAYDELIFVANKNAIQDEKLVKFMNAITQATDFIRQNPDQAWQSFVAYKPKELDNELNKLAWADTLPHLPNNPKALDINRYQAMADFMYAQNLTKKLPNVSEYAIELP